jgi:hypothetical protein
MEILRSDGRLSSGVLCLYQLPTGQMIYCECATEDGDAFTFPAAKTLMVNTLPTPDGRTSYSMFRADKAFGGPQRIRLSRLGVIVTDCTDAEIIRAARGALSGLVLPPGGAGN